VNHIALDAIIGNSPAIAGLRELIRTVAPTRLSILIEGQTGSGKELVAAAIHEESGRRGSFVPFNVCAIGDSMFEDALFGHVRGAFTGAAYDTLGFFREANGGTVFLDELSGLQPLLQAKLLRAIETGEFRPVCRFSKLCHLFSLNSVTLTESVSGRISRVPRSLLG
jgi:DNA-binding NtrC family response regulator